MAFCVLNESTTLDYLNKREVLLGGYISVMTMFYPVDSTSPSVPVLFYVATPSNEQAVLPTTTMISF